jgi:hypothetical protein
VSAIDPVTNSLPPTQSSVTGTSETPQQQAEAALLGATANETAGETPQQSAAATLVDLSPATSAVPSELRAGEAPNLVAASALVSSLVEQIGSSGSTAANAYQLLSASATYSLTKP